MSVDLKSVGQSVSSQFEGLSGRPPGQWPLLPRLMCGLLVIGMVVGGGYFLYWSTQFEEQEALIAKEESLKTEFRAKVAQAVNLPALIAQKAQVDQYVDRLQKQLPSKAEMAALLSDINQAGVGRGLAFESFKPGAVVVRDYYAEQPIDIKVTGRYHDIGAFAGDMASLPRIVTLNNMSLTTGKDGTLTLEAIAKTFRYLDPEEANAQRKARTERDKNAKKGAAK